MSERPGVLGWQDGRWLNEPADWSVVDGDLVVTSDAETDFWRVTQYGFVHDSGHVLAWPTDGDFAAEAELSGAFTALYDQAGLMLRASAEQWVKATVELSDGVPQASVVVTDGRSDWSVAPLAMDPADVRVAFRMSRKGDALTVRCRVGDEPWMLLRLAWLDPRTAVRVGVLCCSPTRAGLRVRFGPVRLGPPEDDLHG